LENLPKEDWEERKMNVVETMVARGQAITEKMAHMDKKKRFITNNHSNKFLKNILPMKTECILRKFYKVSDQNI